MAGKKFIEIKEDDIVEFFIYPKLDATITDPLAQFSIFFQHLDIEAKNISKEYLWHQDPFTLQPQFCDPVPYFYGSLRYGENIEDEWFLVYMLLELTKKFEDIVVRVKDQDGEFLLIESAEFLPSWVTPETCEDKVFLHKGHMHILPLNYDKNNEGNEETFQTTEEVLEFIRQQPAASKVSAYVERPILNRIGDYPNKLTSHLHFSTVYIPNAVAAVLNHDPSLVTTAVRAFCSRDPIDVSACRAMKFFPPEQRVLSRVKFTKCSYAMLVSSKYQPDKRTGWNLPLPSSENYKSHLLGIKLACGFEILMTQAKCKDRGATNTVNDVNMDRDWHKFKASLNKINYFRGLLEHSKEYNQLLNAAQEFYRNSCQTKPIHNAGIRLVDILDTIEIDVEELKRAEEELLRLEQDDDSWMDITKEELDTMLAARFGNLDMVDVPNRQSEEISSHLNTFINHVSGIDGIEFPPVKKTPERPKRGVKNKKKKSVQFSADTKLHSVTSSEQIASKQNRVSIEPDGFMNAVQNILDFAIPDDNYWESDGSGMSSYEDEDDIDLAGPSSSNMNNKMNSYMKEMDRELADTTLAKSFIKKQSKNSDTKDNSDDEGLDEVDIDMNALKNIIISYRHQNGEAGPAEHILGPLGVNLEDIDADVD